MGEDKKPLRKYQLAQSREYLQFEETIPMRAVRQGLNAVAAAGRADVGTVQAEHPMTGATPPTFPRASPQSQGPRSPVAMQAE